MAEGNLTTIQEKLKKAVQASFTAYMDSSVERGRFETDIEEKYKLDANGVKALKARIDFFIAASADPVPPPVDDVKAGDKKISEEDVKSLLNTRYNQMNAKVKLSTELKGAIEKEKLPPEKTEEAEASVIKWADTIASAIVSSDRTGSSGIPMQPLPKTIELKR